MHLVLGHLHFTEAAPQVDAWNAMIVEQALQSLLLVAPGRTLVSCERREQRTGELGLVACGQAMQLEE